MPTRKRRPLLGRHFATFVVTRLYSNEKCRVFCFQCGKSKTLWKGNLPKVQSCGCARRRLISQRLTRHGHARHGHRSATFRSFVAMHERCECKTNHKYPAYGGANCPVKVCSRWSGRNGFKNFLADVGERPLGTTLGRFCDLGWYKPGNCRWMTQAEQTAERRKKFLLRKA